MAELNSWERRRQPVLFLHPANSRATTRRSMMPIARVSSSPAWQTRWEIPRHIVGARNRPIRNCSSPVQVFQRATAVFAHRVSNCRGGHAPTTCAKIDREGPPARTSRSSLPINSDRITCAFSVAAGQVRHCWGKRANALRRRVLRKEASPRIPGEGIRPYCLTSHAPQDDAHDQAERVVELGLFHLVRRKDDRLPSFLNSSRISLKRIWLTGSRPENVAEHQQLRAMQPPMNCTFAGCL
jgi:hypothetical protein